MLVRREWKGPVGISKLTTEPRLEQVLSLLLENARILALEWRL